VSAATVSSLMMGFAWGSGGLTVPFVGRIADLAGLDLTLRGLALVPLTAAALAMLLPPRPSITYRRLRRRTRCEEPRGTIVS
jgi:FSR family fosmidomycin resistance protein-like MFS transporter